MAEDRPRTMPTETATPRDFRVGWLHGTVQTMRDRHMVAACLPSFYGSVGHLVLGESSAAVQ